jgi:pimeloyl-ACP methyl ester carboxylesterase
MRFAFRTLGLVLSLAGLAALILGGMIATPLAAPPPLASIQSGAQKVDFSGAPQPTYFSARDGTQLGYRFYPAEGGGKQTAILIHGSAGSSLNKHAVAAALAKQGVSAVAIDVRGHGVSGTRGDVAYVGQIEDDLADLLATLKLQDRPILVGHSLGGGFALRVARGPLADKFSRFVLVSPFLGVDAPPSRPPSGGARWTEVDTSRIVALTIMDRFGLHWCEGLPVIAFALPPGIQKYVTPRYSYRLLASFSVKDSRYRDLSGIDAPIEIVAGADDELMIADRYAAVAATGARARATIVPGVDHMGAAREPAAIEAIVAAVKG